MLIIHFETFFYFRQARKQLQQREKGKRILERFRKLQQQQQQPQLSENYQPHLLQNLNSLTSTTSVDGGYENINSDPFPMKSSPSMKRGDEIVDDAKIFQSGTVLNNQHSVSRFNIRFSHSNVYFSNLRF